MVMYRPAWHQIVRDIIDSEIVECKYGDLLIQLSYKSLAVVFNTISRTK